tara:strand:- start:3 stop:707 length:705 start_codon:yes stop_codon:yes gene_type:complete
MSRQMSRSEREVEASLALNEWYIQSFMQSDFSRIEYIHTQMCEQWTSPYGRDNSDDWTARDSSWQDYNSPPPWNPKLKDINMDWTQPEKLIEILNMSEYVLNRDLVELPCRDKIVESLEEPLEAWHIAWVKTLCDEAEGYADHDDTDSEEENDAEFEFDEDGAYPMMDSEEEVVRILQRNYGIINEQQEELEQHNHRQELSRKGLGILEKIMEEQKLDEGDYLEMCNIFKELYK